MRLWVQVVLTIFFFLLCDLVIAEGWNDPEEKIALCGVAKVFLGTPYKYGGSTLRGLDCSAFVKKVYGIFDISLPRTTREQIKIGRKIEKYELDHGDLVFFRSDKGTHVGIYVGENQFVHASSLSRKVKVDDMDHPYFKRRFIKAVRINE